MSSTNIRAWFNGEYAAAPVTPSFWMAAPNDFGFQKAASAQSSFQLIPAVLGQNFAGDPFFTDGKAMVLTIR